MSKINIDNTELSNIFKEIFYQDTHNDVIPIIKTSNQIGKIIHFMNKYNTKNDKEISHNISLISNLKIFFESNTNLIPLFMNSSSFSDSMTFFECLLKIFLNDNIVDKQKLLLEEFLSLINYHCSLEKKYVKILFQELGKYFSHHAKIKLTEKLLLRYLNLFNHIFIDKLGNSEKKSSKRVKNYIFFNGINSELSFMLNTSSCNINTDFAYLDKGCSFVFWIKIEQKLIENYLAILQNKKFINLVKIQQQNNIMTLKLLDLKTISYSYEKMNETVVDKKVNISEFFKYNDWNNITFILEKNANLNFFVKIFVNNNIMTEDNDTIDIPDPKSPISSISMFENFLGKVSSILYFSFALGRVVMNYYSALNGYHKKRLLLNYFNSLDKDYYDKNNGLKKDGILPSLSKKLDLKLEKHNINNLMCCFCPITYNKSSNTIDDVFGNFIGKLNKLDGVNVFQKKIKNLTNQCPIDNLLPILELMLSSLKDVVPYANVDQDILTERSFQEYLIVVQKLLNYSKDNILSKSELNFFSSLTIFMEKIPSKFYSMNILQNILFMINPSINKFNAPTSQNTKLNSQLINLILLNERIIIKFSNKVQNYLWNTIFDYLKNDRIIIKEVLAIPKIMLLLRYYDEEKYFKYCCYKHACLFDNGNVYKNKDNIMNPEMEDKVSEFFNVLQYYFYYEDNDNIIDEIFKILSLDLSPCLQKKIISLYINFFNNREIKENKKEKIMSQLLNNRYFEIIEYVLKISLLDVRVEIFNLFNILLTKYESKMKEYLTSSLTEISQIFFYFCYNIFPNRFITEIKDEKVFGKSFITMQQVKKFTMLNDALLEKGKKYIHLNRFFNKSKLEKDYMSFWQFLKSSLRIDNKDKVGYAINPAIFDLTIEFVSNAPPLFLDEFLMEVTSLFNDESIQNGSFIFYKDKLFFPWIIDTVYTYYSAEILNTVEDRELIMSIQGVSINVLFNLFIHQRMNEEIYSRLRYLIDYAYNLQAKYRNNDKKMQEIIKMTRFILVKIFQTNKLFMDIKSIICFEFMFAFKNSQNLYKDVPKGVKKNSVEISQIFSWGTALTKEIEIENNRLSLEEEKEKNIKLNQYYLSDNASIISYNKNDGFFGECIPDYLYQGIFCKENLGETEEKLEYVWKDYKLFYEINEFYRNNIWGLESLCKKAKIKYEPKEIDTIIPQLYKFFGETKENKNYLINLIIRGLDFQARRQKAANVFYIKILRINQSKFFPNAKNNSMHHWIWFRIYKTKR